MTAQPESAGAPQPPRLAMGTVVTHRLFNDWLGVVLEARGPGQWWVWWGNRAKVMEADDLVCVPVPLVTVTTEQLQGELARRGHRVPLVSVTTEQLQGELARRGHRLPDESAAEGGP